MVLACGHAAPKGAAEPVEPPLRRSYPALAWVPAEATYVVTGRVADVARAGRELLAPLSMVAGAGPARLERALRRLTGLNPLDERELAAAGIAVDGTGVMFSTGVWPTFAVGIEDPQALDAHLQKHWPRSGVKMRERDGVELFTWDAAPGLAISFARVDGWLLVHADAPGAGDGGVWLDTARAAFAGAGIAAAEDLVRAADRARERLAERGAELVPGVLGLARVGRLLEAAGAAGQCAEAIADTVRGVELSANVSLRSGAGGIALELSPAAAAALADGLAAPPSAGYDAFRADAGLYADLGVDLRWLDQTLARAGCPSPVGGVRDLTRALDAFDARTVHVAIHQLSLDERKIEAAAHVGLRSRRAIERQVLDSIPGRSLLERTLQIAGQTVRVIDLGVVPRIGYQLDDRRGTVAIGSSAIERVFAAGDASSAGSVLAAMGARPARMPDMGAALAVVLEQMGYPAGMARGFVDTVLARYAEAGFSCTLAGSAIELRGWYELMP